MMKMNFKTLVNPVQIPVGHHNAGGTTRIHADFHRPTSDKTSWDKVGHEKSSVYTAVPLVPPVPPKKQPISLTSESTALQGDTFRELRANLAQLFIDSIPEYITSRHPAAELRRVKNMALEFMRFDGLDFDTAIRAAAEIVATCPSALCEMNYEDV